MSTQKTSKSNLIERYANWIIRWRWLVIIGTILTVLAAASGGRFIGFNNDYRVFFSDENPELQAFEEMQKTYTKIDNILFAIEANNGDAFSADALSATEELTNAGWQLPYSLRVDSVTNFQHTTATEDDLIVADLVEDSRQLSSLELKQRKNIALNEPFLINQLINQTASVSGVNVTFQLPGKIPDEAPIAVAAARVLAADLESRYDVDIKMTGMVMLTNSFFESAMLDMSTLVPLMYGIIILVTMLLLRSISATFSTVIVIMFSLATGMGLAGYLGIKLTPPSSAAMTIIMTLAVADSIHILVSMIAAMRRGLDKTSAIKESLKHNFNPVFLTSVTTAIGFLSMNFSDATPFHDLGNITAMGVGAAFVLSVTFLPAIMAVLPLKVSQSASTLSVWMDKLSDWVIRKQKPLLIVSVLVSVAILSFVPKNVLDDNFVSYFDDTMAFRQDSDFVNDNLSGIYQIQYSLETGQENGISNPVFLQQLESFTEWLRQQPEVRHVNTISDTFKRLNKNLNADDPAFYKLPENRELAAQYLLLYELSLPYGLDLNNQLNISKSATQVTVTVSDMGSNALRDIAQRGTLWLAENMQVEAYGVGPAIMFANITKRNISGMIVGTMTALVLISLLIMFALRSFKLGMLSLIPNLLPAGLAFGIWGMFVGEINMAVSMVTGVALGIVVDDTIHFLSKYLRSRREQGFNAEQAVRYAFSNVGVAILVTSFILVAGFSVLSQSSFGLNSSMAFLTAISVGMAVLADFLLLPTLLLLLDKSPIASKFEQTTISQQGKQHA